MRNIKNDIGDSIANSTVTNMRYDIRNNVFDSIRGNIWDKIYFNIWVNIFRNIKNNIDNNWRVASNINMPTIISPQTKTTITQQIKQQHEKH